MAQLTTGLRCITAAWKPSTTSASRCDISFISSRESEVPESASFAAAASCGSRLLRTTTGFWPGIQFTAATGFICSIAGRMCSRRPGPPRGCPESGKAAQRSDEAGAGRVHPPALPPPSRSSGSPEETSFVPAPRQLGHVALLVRDDEAITCSACAGVTETSCAAPVVAAAAFTPFTSPARRLRSVCFSSATRCPRESSCLWLVDSLKQVHRACP